MKLLTESVEAGPRKIKDGDWARVKEIVARHPDILGSFATPVMKIAIFKNELETVKDTVAEPRADLAEFKLFISVASVRGHKMIVKFLERASEIRDAISGGDVKTAEEIVANFDADLDISGTPANSLQSYNHCKNCLLTDWKVDRDGRTP